MSKIVPNLWYTDKAEEAAAFYASLLPNSKVDSVTALPADSPSGPAGSVKVVEFTLMGQPFMAFSAGPLDAFNHSISLMVQCDDQAEIDRLWVALSEGGKIEQCGWLKDRYGLFWQIAPTVLGEMMKDSDRARAKRVAEAMLKMIKLDIEGLKKAYEGRQRLRANPISSRPPFRTFPPLGRSAARTMPRRYGSSAWSGPRAVLEVAGQRSPNARPALRGRRRVNRLAGTQVRRPTAGRTRVRAETGIAARAVSQIRTKSSSHFCLPNRPSIHGWN